MNLLKLNSRSTKQSKQIVFPNNQSEKKEDLVSLFLILSQVFVIFIILRWLKTSIGTWIKLQRLVLWNNKNKTKMRKKMPGSDGNRSWLKRYKQQFIGIVYFSETFFFVAFTYFHSRSLWFENVLIKRFFQLLINNRISWK